MKQNDALKDFLKHNRPTPTEGSDRLGATVWRRIERETAAAAPVPNLRWAFALASLSVVAMIATLTLPPLMTQTPTEADIQAARDVEQSLSLPFLDDDEDDGTGVDELILLAEAQ